MNEEEVNRCQIQEWYPKFKTHTIRTRIHRLPELFVDYLLDDSKPFLLPVSVADDDALPNRVRNSGVDSDCQLSDGSDDEDDDGPEPPSFPELELAMKSSVEALGGAAFPKLNWSAPKDAAWISTAGNLRCTSLSEIALLLRSSDSIVHDLCHAYDSCSSDGQEAQPRRSRPEIVLALRKWCNLDPEMEFRCFVKDRSLIGVSQRETTTFYPATAAKKAGLRLAIAAFFTKVVRERFESENYTFDVYVTKMETVKLVDINTWRGSTLPLLFSWEELDEMRSGELEMRIVESRQEVRPGLKTAVPYDYMDTSTGSGWDQLLKNADQELRRQSTEEAGG